MKKMLTIFVAVYGILFGCEPKSTTVTIRFDANGGNGTMPV